MYVCVICVWGGGVHLREITPLIWLQALTKRIFIITRIIAYINYPLIHTHTGVVRSSEYCVMAVQRSVEIEKNKERTKIT